MKYAECVGCGYCCRKAPCAAAVQAHGEAVIDLYRKGEGHCPSLIWDGRRYWCELCQHPVLGARYCKELAAGEGCCCSLNTDRKRIPPPKKNPPIWEPLTLAQAKAYIAQGSIPVFRTEGFSIHYGGEPQKQKGVYYYVGAEGEKELKLGKTLITMNKVDALIEFGFPEKWLLRKMNYFSDRLSERGITPEQFLGRWRKGQVVSRLDDWADQFVAWKSKAIGLDHVILLREPDLGGRVATEVIDLSTVISIGDEKIAELVSED